jgi:DNA-binding NtrC family response regulator
MASVPLVEDESLIRMMIADMLSELGHRGRRSQQSGDRPGARLRSRHRAAILDVKLGNDSSEAIAQVLSEHGVPFAFASGYGAEGVPEAFKDHLSLQKPSPIDQLAHCLSRLLG